MLTQVSLVLQSIIPLHSREKECPQHMTSDWFIILLAACFTPALTFLACWNLYNWLCVSVCFSAIGSWCFFSHNCFCLNECIICHICVGCQCHHCQRVHEVRSNCVEKHSGLQMLMVHLFNYERWVYGLLYVCSSYSHSLSCISFSPFPSYCQPSFCEHLQALFPFSRHLHLPISVYIQVLFLICA